MSNFSSSQFTLYFFCHYVRSSCAPTSISLLGRGRYAFVNSNRCTSLVLHCCNTSLSLQPVHVNVKAETKAASEAKTLAVLLPCREKGSKTTKIWLRRLQQYLYYHYKSGQSKSQFKILTLFSCHARERLAIMERPDLAGILSFEPRPSKATAKLKENILDNFDNVTEVNYCDQRSLTTLQLARLGARLSKSGNLNVVYTYSSASASAMKLLANLILQGQVPIAGTFL